MSGFVWRIGRLAWMRRQCIPWDGIITGWACLFARLYWYAGHGAVQSGIPWDRAGETAVRAAYVQGWIDGNGARRVYDLGQIHEETGRRADHYVECVFSPRAAGAKETR